MDKFLKKLGNLAKKFEKILIGILVIIFVAIILVAVSGYSIVKSLNQSSSISGRAVGSAPTVMDEMMYSEASVDYSKNVIMPPEPGGSASTPELPQDKKIIRNGSLSLLVKNSEEVVDEISTIVESADGFVENVSLSEYSEGIKSGYITVRVPADRFFEVFTSFKELAVKVQNENVGTTDVTAQYVDLEANLDNLKTEEKQYQKIMDSAKSIEDILKVSEKLSNVRNRIERLEGQINLLSRQVSMSTITVSLTAEKQVQVFGIVWRPLTIIKQAFRDMLSGFIDLINWLINLAFKLPVLILKLIILVLIIVGVWKLLVWGRRLIFRK